MPRHPAPRGSHRRGYGTASQAPEGPQEGSAPASALGSAAKASFCAPKKSHGHGKAYWCPLRRPATGCDWAVNRGAVLRLLAYPSPDFSGPQCSGIGVKPHSDGLAPCLKDGVHQVVLVYDVGGNVGQMDHHAKPRIHVDHAEDPRVAPPAPSLPAPCPLRRSGPRPSRPFGLHQRESGRTRHRAGQAAPQSA